MAHLIPVLIGSAFTQSRVLDLHGNYFNDSWLHPSKYAVLKQWGKGITHDDAQGAVKGDLIADS